MVSAAFILLIIVQVRETLECSRITDEARESCLVVTGLPDHYQVAHSTRHCRNDTSIWAMREDRRNSPIVYQEKDGPLWCLTDDRRLARVGLQLCDDRPTQRWSIRNHHLVSDAAAHMETDRACLAREFTITLNPDSLAWRALYMEPCNRHNRQMFYFGRSLPGQVPARTRPKSKSFLLV